MAKHKIKQIDPNVRACYFCLDYKQHEYLKDLKSKYHLPIVAIVNAILIEGCNRANYTTKEDRRVLSRIYFNDDKSADFYGHSTEIMVFNQISDHLRMLRKKHFVSQSTVLYVLIDWMITNQEYRTAVIKTAQEIKRQAWKLK